MEYSNSLWKDSINMWIEALSCMWMIALLFKTLKLVWLGKNCNKLFFLRKFLATEKKFREIWIFTVISLWLRLINISCWFWFLLPRNVVVLFDFISLNHPEHLMRHVVGPLISINHAIYKLELLNLWQHGDLSWHKTYFQHKIFKAISFALLLCSCFTLLYVVRDA